MRLFSFLKKEKQLRCDWCKKEIQTPAYTKFVNGKTYNFCSESCKKEFRRCWSKKHNSCPLCALRR